MNPYQSEYDELIKAINLIKYQINLAKSRAAEGHDYADSAWFRKTEADLKTKQRQAQEAQRKIGEWNRQQRAARGRAFDEAFINAVKDFVGEAKFEELWERAYATSRKPLDEKLAETA